ncbi:MAG TPA: ATP-binding protein [Planctomycetota bacterium]|nr:ATP-binding protein [Planctomycetota bacterium]
MTDTDRDGRLTRFEALAAGLAHEIRNPLSTINITLQLLREELAERPGARENGSLKRVDVVLGELRRLERIVGDFLRLAREPSAERRRCDLNVLVEDAVNVMAADFRKARVAVTLQLDRSLPPTDVDDSLLRQAVLNLLRNAAQAMEGGGTLTVQTRRDRGRFTLEVIDTGPGMPPEVRDRVFDLFFSTKPGGVGIGLPLVRQFVELHGGTVRCESEPGHGTRFTLELPLVASAERPAP